MSSLTEPKKLAAKLGRVEQAKEAINAGEADGLDGARIRTSDRLKPVPNRVRIVHSRICLIRFMVMPMILDSSRIVLW